ncbi:MAG TPA: transporter substrate-binding domain-containing protein [Actinomycetota bacterium]|nr:transporter substrate-binding domain-containing protein [Actinomycetota bacterium]
MNKLRIMLAAAAAFVLLAACAGNEPEDGVGATGATNETGATGATGETGAIPEFSTLEEGVLQVGSCLDYPPFEQVKNGEEVGFDVDMTEEIASRLGLTVEWIRADFDTIFTAVAGGQFDMVAAASTITEEREQTVDFSDSYFNSRQALVINTNETPDIASTDDLQEGDVVGVQRGTTGAAWARDNLESNGIELQTFTSATDGLRALEGGGMTAFIADEPFVAEAIADLPSLEVVEGIDTDEKYGFAFSPENPELHDAVNVVLAEIIADGTYRTFYEKWFPGAPLPPEFEPTA